MIGLVSFKKSDNTTYSKRSSSKMHTEIVKTVDVNNFERKVLHLLPLNERTSYYHSTFEVVCDKLLLFVEVPRIERQQQHSITISVESQSKA